MAIASFSPVAASQNTPICTRYFSPEVREVGSFWKVDRRNNELWPRQLFPRSQGPFIRRSKDVTGYERELIVGQWALVPLVRQNSEAPLCDRERAQRRIGSEGKLQTAVGAWAALHHPSLEIRRTELGNWQKQMVTLQSRGRRPVGRRGLVEHMVRQRNWQSRRELHHVDVERRRTRVDESHAQARPKVKPDTTGQAQPCAFGAGRF